MVFPKFANISDAKIFLLIFRQRINSHRSFRKLHAGNGKIRFIRNDKIDADLSANLSICNEINPETYCVESPDGISPASGKSRSFMRYADTGISAGICHEGNGYRTVCLGFPIETLDSEEDIDRIIRLTLEFFSR